MNNIDIMPATNSSTLSANNPSYWIAALVGAIAAVGLWTKQQTKQQQKKKDRRRKSSSDDTSDTISVEGSVMVTLPSWAIASSSSYFSRHYRTDLEMMSLAIHLSDRNISEGTGGPFGAAIFERHPSKGYCTLVSIGMNRVVPLGNSTLHGETVAIQLAQRKVGSYTLSLEEGGDGQDGLFYDEDGEEDDPICGECVEEEKISKDATSSTAAAAAMGDERRKRQFELFTSCEPCAMCLGATLWSGVSRIVCGATKTDAQAIGFDEGPVYEQSYEHLEKCGVAVTRNVMSDEAAKVLRRYGNEGLIYNR
mmetsp:Transcript_22158/g.40679  ORF Transcript_22158/g.40679 Transcript_22158/m.40679 type:complete len:308 (-) Transcript_22158:59-982(-)